MVNVAIDDFIEGHRFQSGGCSLRIVERLRKAALREVDAGQAQRRRPGEEIEWEARKRKELRDDASEAVAHTHGPAAFVDPACLA